MSFRWPSYPRKVPRWDLPRFPGRVFSNQGPPPCARGARVRDSCAAHARARAGIEKGSAKTRIH